jgi:hypothetical protein
MQLAQCYAMVYEASVSDFFVLAIHIHLKG